MHLACTLLNLDYWTRNDRSSKIRLLRYLSTLNCVVSRYFQSYFTALVPAAMEEMDDSTSRRASEQSADSTKITEEAAKSSRETTEPDDVKTNSLLVVSPSAESQEVGAIDRASSSSASCRRHKRTRLDQKMGSCSSTAVSVDDSDSDTEDAVVRNRKISVRTQLSIVPHSNNGIPVQCETHECEANHFKCDSHNGTANSIRDMQGQLGGLV